MKKDERIRILLSKELKRLAEARAKENGESFNAYIRRLVGSDNNAYKTKNKTSEVCK